MKKSLWAAMPLTALVLSVIAGCNTPTSSSVSSSASSVSSSTSVSTKKEVRIGVDNDAWATALETYFTQNPVADNITVKVVNSGAQGAADKITTDHEAMPDVQFVIDGEVAKNFSSLATLNAATLANMTANAPADYVEGASVLGVKKYVPVTYDGMAFAWNETMLTAIGISTADANGDNLPDAIDTYEEIFAITKGWYDNPATRPTYKTKAVETLNMMSLTEVWSGYSSLTAEGWQIFPTNEPLEPGFDDPKFAKGLGFIAAAADNYSSVVKDDNGNYVLKNATDVKNDWEAFINNETAALGLVGTWMDVAGAETKTGSNFRFSKMPTYKGNQLTPFVKTKGFVINGYSKNPAEAKLVFEKLYSEAAMQVMVDNTANLPALKVDAAYQVEVATENGQEMSLAFLGNHKEPSLKLPANPSQDAMGAVYYYSNSKIQEVFQAAWNGAATHVDDRATWLDTLAAQHKAVADAGLTELNKAPTA